TAAVVSFPSDLTIERSTKDITMVELRAMLTGNANLDMVTTRFFVSMRNPLATRWKCLWKTQWAVEELLDSDYQAGCRHLGAGFCLRPAVVCMSLSRCGPT